MQRTASDGTGDVAEQIHLVNGLVDDRPSALDVPTAFARARVVRRFPVPFHVGVRLEQFAQPAFSHRFLEEDRAVREPFLTDDCEGDARLATLLDNSHAGFRGRCERLLHQQVLPPARSGAGQLIVRVRVCAEDDQLDGRVFKDLVRATVEPGLEALGKSPRLLRRPAGHTLKLCSRNLLDCKAVVNSDCSGANDCDLHLVVPSVGLLKSALDVSCGLLDPVLVFNEGQAHEPFPAVSKANTRRYRHFGFAQQVTREIQRSHLPELLG